MTSQSSPNSSPSPTSAPDGGRPGPGAIVAGKFELAKLVGQGGMGSVWTARHLSLGVDVALKFIDVDTPELRSRFAHEAQAVARIQSPHVVHVHDFGTDEAGRPYIAMELLQGEELGIRVDREGRLPIDQVERILVQAAKGLGKAHQAGVVHRDIKPDNLFLVDDDDGFLVKLLDFGIAKIDVLGSAVHHKTTTGSLMGTPLYMSPEQVLGSRKVDSRSDLYSLAVVAYRALTGTVPHDAPALGELIVNISTKAPPPPSTFVPLPASVDAFFARALAKEPDDRWGTAREMAEAFTLACRGESFSKLDLRLDLPPSTPSRSEMVTPSVEEYERLLAQSSQSALPPHAGVPAARASSQIPPPVGSPVASPAASQRPPSVGATPGPSVVGASGARPQLTSTAHAQTLPNISAPPPPPAKSRLGIALAVVLAAGSLAVAFQMTNKPSVDERLAKSQGSDGVAPSAAPSATTADSHGMGIGIGIPDPAASSASPSVPAPPTVMRPPTTKVPVPAVGKKKVVGGKRTGTSKSPRPGEAYPL